MLYRLSYTIINIFHNLGRKVKTEIEINMKRSYWLGALDMLNIPDIAKSEKYNKERVTAQTWLDSLDWMLTKSGEANSEVEKPTQ